MAWPYLMAPARWWVMFHSRSAVSVLTGALSPSDLSQRLKSRFIPYLNAIEQSASRPLAWSSPPQGFQLRKLFAGTVSTTLGMSAGSTITAPFALSTAMALSITPRCAGPRPPLAFPPVRPALVLS